MPPMVGVRKAAWERSYRARWTDTEREQERRRIRVEARVRRVVVLEAIGRGRLECRRCHSTDYRALEVNHVNGGGNREVRKGVGSSANLIVLAVWSGRRRFDDLEVLCRPCNAVDHLERMYPDMRGQFAVSWNPGGSLTLPPMDGGR